MWDTQEITPQVHVCEQHVPWRWKWLGDVAKLTHVMMKELIAHETWHWVMWSRWRRSRHDLARRTGCKCEGQVEWWLGVDGPRQWWRASEVKIDEPIWSCDDMKWIISLLIVLVHVLHWHFRKWNGMRKAKVLKGPWRLRGGWIRQLKNLLLNYGLFFKP